MSLEFNGGWFPELDCIRKFNLIKKGQNYAINVRNINQFMGISGFLKVGRQVCSRFVMDQKQSVLKLATKKDGDLCGKAEANLF